jgi:hypothetical protein
LALEERPLEKQGGGLESKKSGMKAGQFFY